MVSTPQQICLKWKIFSIKTNTDTSQSVEKPMFIYVTWIKSDTVIVITKVITQNKSLYALISYVSS